VYERLYGPLGPVRADYHAALVSSVIAGVHAEKKSDAPSPADFMPDWEEAATDDGDDP
jgi:hypothetical protein